MEKIKKNDINYVVGDAIVKEIKNELAGIIEKIEKDDINYVVGDAIVKEMKNDVLCLKRTLRVNRRTR